MVNLLAALILLAPAQSERQQAFKWFDTLGFTEALKRPFVQVDAWSNYAGKEASLYSFAGFQQAGNAQAFRILKLDLGEYAYRKGEHSWEEAELLPMDFKTWAQSALDQSKRPPKYEDPWTRNNKRVAFFVLARVCDLKGEEELSDKVFEAAQHMDLPNDKDQDQPYISRIQQDIAARLLLQTYTKFGDPKVSRETLLAELTVVAAHAPETRAGKFAREDAEIVAKMVREDVHHQTPSPEALAKMPVKERVSELIFQLRDQNGYQYSMPGFCDVFADPRGERSAAHQLAAIGLAAVPQLIEAIADPRYSRSTGFFRSGDNTHVLSVGEAAAQVISRIAHKEIWSYGVTGDPERIKEVQVQARAWWQEVSALGEAGLLAKGVRAGGSDAATQAERLIELAPAKATAAIDEGIRRTEDSFARKNLIESLAKLKTPEAHQIAVRQMLGGKDSASRLAAAKVVATTDLAAAVDAMISLWRSPSFHRKKDAEFDGGPEAVCAFLASSGRPEAVRALFDHLAERTQFTRSAVVEQFLTGEVPDEGWLFLEGTKRQQSIAQRTAYRQAVEQLLASELTDTALSGSMITIGKTNLAGYSIGGLAVYGLAQWFPHKYTFHEAPTTVAENNLRIAALGVWKQGAKRLTRP